jgi:capsular exopolysaccharide synthesis family protein
MKFPKFIDLKRMLKAYYPPPYVVKFDRNPDGVDGRIVTYTDRSSHVAEQYKILRTNIYYLSPDRPLKTILITSAQAQEGKTITACNLAITLSMDPEKKVLLVDADFRRPMVHTMFGISGKSGFFNILDGDAEIEDFVSKPSIGNLYIMPAGTVKANPSEILISTKIKDVIEKLKSKFDYVLFDSPPVLSVTDASVLGSLCDGVFLVVKSNRTQRSIIEEAFNLLGEAKANPKGCILTNSYMMLDYQYYFQR